MAETKKFTEKEKAKMAKAFEKDKLMAAIFPWEMTIPQANRRMIRVLKDLTDVSNALEERGFDKWSDELDAAYIKIREVAEDFAGDLDELSTV